MGFADLLEHAAALLATAEPGAKWCLRSLSDLDGVQLATEHYCRVSEDAGQDPTLGMIPADAVPSDITGPLSYGLLCDATAHDHVDSFWCCVIRPVRWATLRGVKPPFLSPFHVRLVVGIVTYSGRHELASFFATWDRRRNDWCIWGGGREPHYNPGLSQRLRIAIGALFTSRYEWHALVRARSGAPRVSIPCSGKQAQKLFAMRELPAGAKRRAALRHWVGEHFRPASATRVRPHFRGVEQFDWEGLSVDLVPPAFDREQVEKAQQRALASRKG